MEFIDRIQNLLERLGSYPLPVVAIELILIWIVVYAVVRFLSGTRAAGALKAILLVVLVLTLAFRILGGGEAFSRLQYLYDRLLALIAIALVVIFQPELRRGLIRIGEAKLFRSGPLAGAETVEPIVKAVGYLAKQRMGAIMAIEGEVGLKGLVEGGVELDAKLTAPLLQSIFFPGSALHDLAVVIRGAQVKAAAVQFPLADPSEMPDPALGSRHRAAVGLTKDCDALVVVVSEETGNVRIAQRGRLSRPYDEEELRAQLRRRLGVQDGKKKATPQAPDDDDASVSLSGRPPKEALETEESRSRSSKSSRPAGKTGEVKA